MFRRNIRAYFFLLSAVVILLTACGQQAGSTGLATTAPTVAPTNTPSSPTTRGSTILPSASPTTAARQATPAQSTGSASADTSKITLGKPVYVVNGSRIVVAVQATNGTDRYVNITVEPTVKAGAKTTLTVSNTISQVAPGATRTAVLITDDVTAKGYELLDVQVTNVIPIAGGVDPNLAQRIRIDRSAVKTEGSRSTVASDITSENPKRVTFYVRYVFVKDGVIVGTAGAEIEAQPNVTKPTTFVIDGSPEGATIQTEISRIIER